MSQLCFRTISLPPPEDRTNQTAELRSAFLQRKPKLADKFSAGKRVHIFTTKWKLPGDYLMLHDFFMQKWSWESLMWLNELKTAPTLSSLKVELGEQSPLTVYILRVKMKNFTSVKVQRPLSTSFIWIWGLWHWKFSEEQVFPGNLNLFSDSRMTFVPLKRKPQMFLFKKLMSTVWLCRGELYKEEVTKPVLLRRRSSLGSAPYSRMFSQYWQLGAFGSSSCLVALVSDISAIQPGE